MSVTNFLKGLFTPEFIRRMGGALLAGGIHGGFEAAFNSGWRGLNGFPYGTVIHEVLPPLDSWLLMGGSLATWGLGAWKNKKVKEVGEGMVFYTAAMWLHTIIVRATRLTVALAPAAAAPEVPTTVAELLARKGYTPTKAVQLRNGRYTPTMPGRLGYTPTA